MPQESLTTHTPANAPPEPAPRSARLSIGYGWMLALAYFVGGAWAATTGAWHGGELLWHDADTQQADAMRQSFTLALVIGWLVYGLAWPVRIARPWVWIALGVLQLVVLLVAGLWLIAIGAAVLHVLAFDPRWLGRVVPSEPEPLFYDGYCGLCHRWVKIVMHADHDGALFYFAPLQGEAIKSILTDQQRESLPDSIVVRTHDGRVLCKSAAVVYILTALGGWHRLGAIAMRLIPGPIRDLGYDTVAKVRHRLFKKPSEACPMMPEELRDRFRF